MATMRPALARFWSDSAAPGDRLADPPVRPGAVEVRDIRAEDAPQVRLAEDGEVVQALPPHAADGPLAGRVGAWGADRRAQHSDSARGGEAVEARPVLRVVIANQEPWPLVERRRLAQLLRDPGVGRVPRHPDMDDPARPVRDDEERVHGAEQLYWLPHSSGAASRRSWSACARTASRMARVASTTPPHASACRPACWLHAGRLLDCAGRSKSRGGTPRLAAGKLPEPRRAQPSRRRGPRLSPERMADGPGRIGRPATYAALGVEKRGNPRVAAVRSIIVAPLSWRSIAVERAGQ